jgi:hypothetical protein
MKKLFFFLIALGVFTAQAQNDSKNLVLIYRDIGETFIDAKKRVIHDCGFFFSSKLLKTNCFDEKKFLEDRVCHYIDSLNCTEIISLDSSSYGVSVIMKIKIPVYLISSFIKNECLEVSLGEHSIFQLEMENITEYEEEKIEDEIMNLHNWLMPKSFNYNLNIGNKIDLDNNKSSWNVPLDVTVTANDSMMNYLENFIKELEIISIKENELKKNISYGMFPNLVIINFKNKTHQFLLRSKNSLFFLEKFLEQFDKYVSNFEIINNIDTIHGFSSEFIPKYSKKFYSTKELKFNINSLHSDSHLVNSIEINFPSNNEIVAKYSLNYKQRVENLKRQGSFKIKPFAYESAYLTNGRFDWYEENSEK